MKKLLTLMLAVAMIFSFASVAMAADVTLTLDYVSDSNDPPAHTDIQFLKEATPTTSIGLDVGTGLSIDADSITGTVVYDLKKGEETVDFNGSKTFTEAGTYTLTATVGTFSDTLTITVTALPSTETEPTVKVSIDGGSADTMDFGSGTTADDTYHLSDAKIDVAITAPTDGIIESVVAYYGTDENAEGAKTGITPTVATDKKTATVAVVFPAGGKEKVTVEIDTVAEDGTTDETYTLTLTAAKSTEYVPTVMVDGEKVTGLSTSVTSKTIEFPYSTTAFEIVVLPAEHGKTSTAPVITGISVGSMAVGESGYTIPVTVGAPAADGAVSEFTVKFTAYAEDESEYKEYTLTFRRAEASTATELKIEGKSASASSFALTADATSEEYAYTVSDGASIVIPEGGKLALTATKGGAAVENPTATATVSGGKIKLAGMKNGENYVVTVVVKPEKANAPTATYFMNITCEITTPVLDALYLSSSSSNFGSNQLEADKTSYSKEITDSTYYVGFKYDSRAYNVNVKLNGNSVSSSNIKTSGDITYAKLTGLGNQQNTLDDTVTIEVSVKGGTTKTTYTVDITALDDIDGRAIVDKMHISSSSTKTSSTYTKYFDFDPYFHVERLNYDVLIDEDYEEDYIYIHFEADDDFDVKVSGATKIEADDRGSYVEYVYRIATPATNKDVKVEIEIVYDRNSGSDDENTYELNFCFEASSDAFLDDVDAYIGTSSKRGSSATMYPAFDKDITEYVILMPYDTSEKYIYFDIEEGKDCDFDYDSDLTRTKISGTYYYTDSVSTGDTTYTIEAYNKDSGETTDYKFTVIRAKDKASDEDKLEDLILRTKTSSSKYAISLDKKFSANDYNYSATVDEDQKKVYVYADAEDTDAIVIVNGEICGSYVAVDLEKGANKIQIVCAAENCDDVTEYTVTVYRGEGSSELTGLTLYSGNTSIDLSPKFSKTDYAYTTTVANSIKGINIAPVTDAAYTVVKNTATGVSSTVYKSTGVGYLALNEGLNSLTVTTVGSDLSVSIYHVAVWRQPAKVSPTVSTQNLTVDGKAKTLSTYNISGNNFIKLRDLAALLDGTDKEFAISDTASTKKVTLTSDSSYKKLGTELTKLPAAKKSAATTWSFYLDGTQVKFTAYNIDGANYVMLRDMALFMDFGLTYNGTTRTIAIDTDDNYTPGK